MQTRVGFRWVGAGLVWFHLVVGNLAARTPIFVVIGGYQTCRTSHELVSLPVPKIGELADLAKRIGDEIETKTSLRAKYFLGCYSGIFRGFPLTRMEFQYSESAAFAWPETIPLNTGDFNSPEPLRPAFEALNRLIDETPDPVVYFVGHSYGAWTVTHAAAQLRSTVAIGGVVTLDAVSPAECKPDELALRTFASLLVPLRNPHCTRAPLDLNEATETLTTRAAWWHHYYQTQFSLLHSGPLARIGEMNPEPARPTRGFNVLVRLPATHPIFNDYHSALAVESRVWRNVSQWIQRDF